MIAKVNDMGCECECNRWQYVTLVCRFSTLH